MERRRVDAWKKYARENWKLGCHLLFRTYRFGVNNRWWNEFDSWFGYPMWKKILRVILIVPLLREWTCIKFRMWIGFIPREDYMLLFKKPFC